MIARARSLHLEDHPFSGAARHVWGIVLGSHHDNALVERPVTRMARVAGVSRPRLRVVDAEALLGRTIDRATRLIAPERLVAVLTRERLPWYEGALRDNPEVQRIVQPADRGTAPEIFLAVRKILHQDPHAIVVVLPGDRLVPHEARFMSYVASAAWAVSTRPELPIVIGAHPRTPDADQAWIDPGPPIEGLERFAIRAVRRLVPEPSPAELHALFEGHGLLNTLVIVAKAATLVTLGRRHLPEVLETLDPLDDAFGRAEENLLCEAVYECMPRASISREMLEAWRNFAVLPIPDAVWSSAPGDGLHDGPVLRALAS